MKRQLEQFYSLYRDGEKSPTIAGRQESFNQALKSLQELDVDTGEYYYDLGNSYFQLEQYPWALFYFLKARKMLPRDAQVQQNIEATFQKLELHPMARSPWIPLSLQEELGIFQLLLLITTVLFSFRVWMRDEWLKPASRIALGLAVLFLLFIGSQHYFTPDQAVLAQAAILYKNAGTEYERVFLDPLPPGTILDIVGEANDGSWTKIVNKEGIVGYIQTDKLLL